MSNKPTQTTVSKLRFPEFSGNWEEKRLGDVIEFSRGTGVSKSDISQNGHTFCIAYGELFTTYNEVINSITSRTSVNTGTPSRVGDILMPASDVTSTGLGTASAIMVSGIRIGGDINILRPLDCINSIFLSYQINSRQKNILKLVTGTTIRHLYSSDIAKIKIGLPHPDEQAKIADCLSSMDDLITAQSKKIKLLRDHKKGLMQQLFPAEGKTLPNLRFPEFRDAPEWKEVFLEDLGDIVSGLTYSSEDVRDQGLLVLRSSNIVDGSIKLEDCVYVREDISGVNYSKHEDILICVNNGSKNLLGKNAIIPKDMPICTHGAFMTVFRANNPAFAFQIFQTYAYRLQVSAGLGTTIHSINSSKLKKYRFFVPHPKEQQKIADCLSSMDDLITAQSKKIKLLQDHKKGLMQQLFPQLDEEVMR